MKYVDIRVPQLAKTIDCKLEEHVKISVLISQLTVLLLGRRAEGILFSLNQKRALQKEQTLLEQGVVSGQTLLLLFI
ncbi:MAG: EsaB/YukD family protein [Lachnospiraceae bacterium]